MADDMMNRMRTIRALQPGFVAVISEVALEALRAKIASARNPLLVWDYAEALDSMIAVLPPEVKGEITRRYGVDVDVAVEEALGRCEDDPYSHPYVNAVACARLVKAELDKLLRVVFDVAHKRGLFTVGKEVIVGGEV